MERWFCAGGGEGLPEQERNQITGICDRKNFIGKASRSKRKVLGDDWGEGKELRTDQAHNEYCVKRGNG